MKTCTLILFWLLWGADTYAQIRTLSGKISDAGNREPLAAATIRVRGTSRGTISNADGLYRLSLPDSNYVIVFSYVGYKTDSVLVRLHQDVVQDMSLQASPVQVAEVVVTGEDPAMGIMRRVIENKKKWVERLRSYELEAFTRQIIRRDTAIAMISESYSTCYWQRGDTLREVVIKKRQTENVKGTQNFAGVGGIVNFYDDTVRLAGFKFIGPTAPNAFDYYDFRLERTRRRTGSDIYDITMIPKTRLVPLFRGTISIAENTYAVAGVSVTPNEAFVIPFVSESKLSYAQQFSLVDQDYWMPVDIRINGFFQIGVAGLTMPPIGVESMSSIYNCKVNPVIPDSIFRRPRRIELKGADNYDSTFWAQREVLPLTGEERKAYRQLDSTQTLEKQFQPSGPLTTLTEFFSETAVGPQLRYDRAEGLFLGVRSTLDSLTNFLKLNIEAGYGFSDKKAKGKIGAELFLDNRHDYSIGVEVYEDINHFRDGNAYGFGENVLPALFYKIDYFDYYYSRGFNISITGSPLNRTWLAFGYRNEDQSNAFRRTNYSLFSQGRTFESNPAIAQGVLRELWLHARYGQEPLPIPIIPRNYIELRVDRSAHLLSSAFEYTEFTVAGEYHINSFLRSLFLPPSLMVKWEVGASAGKLPPQQIYYFDAPLTGYAPIGVLKGVRMKEFSGDSYFLLSIEHNLRSVPFLWLNIPYLYKNSMELLMFVNMAQSWNYTASVPTSVHRTNGVYAECGLGISRILGLLRFDVAYRLTSPQRWVMTVGTAMLL